MYLRLGYVLTGICDSVHRGSVANTPWADTPLGRSPPAREPPLGRLPPLPWPDTPRHTPSWADTTLSRPPSPRQILFGQCMLGCILVFVIGLIQKVKMSQCRLILLTNKIIVYHQFLLKNFLKHFKIYKDYYLIDTHCKWILWNPCKCYIPLLFLLGVSVILKYVATAITGTEMIYTTRFIASRFQAK